MESLAFDPVWFAKNKYSEAERQHYEGLAKPQVLQPPSTISPKKSRKNKKDKSKSKSPPKEDNKIEQKEDRSVSFCTNKNEIEKNLKAEYKLLEETDNKLSNNDCQLNKQSESQVPLLKSIAVSREDGKPEKVQCVLANEVAKARQHIKNSLECMDSVAALAVTPNTEIMDKLTSFEKIIESLKHTIESLDKRVRQLETSKPSVNPILVTPAKPPKAKEDSDDGVDLFASESEDDEDAAKVREQRLAAYAAKKSKKPALVAKSNIILDVKTWSDEIDMKELEREVRKVKTDGLLWGASKLVPLAFGVHKLQISCVVEDDKVSIDWLQEELEQMEDLVQSVDIAAFNKV